MGIAGMFENFWFELVKSFAYGVILALLGHVLVTFWRSIRGGAAAIPRLRQQLAELFQLRRDNETGRTSFGPWLVVRELIRITIFIAVAVVIGLVMSEVLMTVVASDRTLQRLEALGTITLRETPIPVPVYAFAFLLAFFIAHLPITGWLMGSLFTLLFGIVLFFAFFTLFRILPIQQEIQDFQFFHGILGGVTRTSLQFSLEGRSWLMPFAHVLVIGLTIPLSLAPALYLLGWVLTLLPSTWLKALWDSESLPYLILTISGFSFLLAVSVIYDHFIRLAKRFEMQSQVLEVPGAVAFAIVVPVCFLVFRIVGPSFMQRLDRDFRW